MITAQLVKELREKTGAGMLDCKNALTATDGDVEKAIDWLREKGIAKAAKKASRIAAEGLCNVVINNNHAYIFEVNSETDFVAKNEKFLVVLDVIGNILVANNCQSAEEALVASYNGVTGNEAVVNATATIGEKISLRRVQCFEKQDNQVFGFYKHMGGKIAVLDVINGDDEDLAKDICMHICASNPRFLDESQAPAEFIEHEKNVLTQEALNEGKPAAIVEKMVVGRINKFLKEICLVDQPFVKNPDITVAEHLKNNHSAIINYVRFEVGEGIEKRVDDFAAEVNAQMEQAQKNAK